ncbi:MAG: hypothetical protein ABI577_01130 [bacterium]
MATLYVGMAGLGLLGAISDATLNQWAESHRSVWLIASYLLWLAVATLFGLFLRSDHLTFGIAVIVFLTVNCAFALVLDVAVFDGSISRQQWLGVAFAAAALVLLETGRADGA